MRVLMPPRCSPSRTRSRDDRNGHRHRVDP
jgi:hypothetical protein